MLLEKGADINVGEENGLTPLMVAAFCGRAQVVELLLRAGADIDRKDKSGYAALAFAQNQATRKWSGSWKLMERDHES